MIFEYLHNLDALNFDLMALCNACSTGKSPQQLCQAVQALGLIDSITKFQDAVELMSSLKKLEETKTFDNFSFLHVAEVAVPPQDDNNIEKQNTLSKIFNIVEKTGKITTVTEYEYDCILYQRSMVDLLREHFPFMVQRFPHLITKIPLPKKLSLKSKKLVSMVTSITTTEIASNEVVDALIPTCDERYWNEADDNNPCAKIILDAAFIPTNIESTNVPPLISDNEEEKDADDEVSNANSSNKNSFIRTNNESSIVPPLISKLNNSDKEDTDDEDSNANSSNKDSFIRTNNESTNGQSNNIPELEFALRVTGRPENLIFLRDVLLPEVMKWSKLDLPQNEAIAAITQFINANDKL